MIITVNKMKIPTSITSWLFSSLAVFFIMTGCESHVDSRGNSPDPKTVKSIQPGVHKRQDVERRLGTPSTTTAFDNEVWYYISGRVKSVAFFKPKLLKRRILTVKFDKNGIVQQIYELDTTKQKEIVFIERETPTKGKELTFIQQVIGNVGKYSNSSGND